MLTATAPKLHTVKGHRLGTLLHMALHSSATISMDAGSPVVAMDQQLRMESARTGSA